MKAAKAQIPTREQWLERERDRTKARLASVLSVSERTVRDWLSRMDKDAKEARDKRIFDLWLACWQNGEIAEEVGLSPAQLTEITSKFGIGSLAKTEIAAAEHSTDFVQPISDRHDGRIASHCAARGRALSEPAEHAYEAAARAHEDQTTARNEMIRRWWAAFLAWREGVRGGGWLFV